MTAAASAPTADGLPPPRRYVAVAAISLGTVVTMADGTIAGVALPTLSRALQAEPSAAVLIVTVYQLVLMITMLPLAALSGRLGLRQTYLGGLALFTVATLLCFVADSLAFLVVVRALQALGAAAALSVNTALIRACYPLSHLGRGLSFNTIIAAAASSLAPTVGGFILGAAAWPWLFASLLPFALLSIVVGYRALPEGARHHQRFDWRSAGMCAAMFGLLIIGLDSAIHSDHLLMSAALLLIGAVVGVTYVRRESRQATPVLPVDLLRLRVIALPCTGSLIAYIGMAIVTIMLPVIAQQRYGFSPAAAGAIIAPVPLVSIVLAPLSGMLSDRYHPGLLSGIGAAFAAAGALSLVFLPDAPTPTDFVWRMAVLGVGIGMFFSPNSRQVAGSAPETRVAAAGALFSTVRGLGQTLGATGVAAMLAAQLGNGPAPMAVTAALMCGAGLFSWMALRIRT